MAPRSHRLASARQGSRLFITTFLVGLGAQLLPELWVSDFVNAEGLSVFAMPSTLSASGTATRNDQLPRRQLVQGLPRKSEAEGRRAHRTTRRVASASFAGIGSRVLNAMGAGAVAAVIQAAISACLEPIVNRVLVKRMKVTDAIRDVKLSMMLDFFKTTISTNLLKFPLFEAINAFCLALPIPAPVRGIFTGLVFTTATLPITNFRYRKSMQLEVKLSNIYEAYFPTVIRDMVYGIVRNYATILTLASFPHWKASSPQLMFIVVILGCYGSAPFNEWRGFLLQSKGQEMTFREFFRPANFVRSTSLGAMQQATALAAGYWCAPVVQELVAGVIGALR